MSRVPAEPKYEPPPRPNPVAGPALTINPTTLERRDMYRQLEAECITHAPSVAAAQADFIHSVYGRKV